MLALTRTYDELRIPYERFVTPEALAKKCVRHG
jgi:hypothetical protein